MLVPKKNRLATYSYLFKGTLYRPIRLCAPLRASYARRAPFSLLAIHRCAAAVLFAEGVLVVKKDDFLPKHPQLEVPNLQVRKMMISLKSRGFVSEVFSWQYHYFSLTDSVRCSAHSTRLPPLCTLSCAFLSGLCVVEGVGCVVLLRIALAR